jgi:hypothetical protein
MLAPVSFTRKQSAKPRSKPPIRQQTLALKECLQQRETRALFRDMAVALFLIALFFNTPKGTNEAAAARGLRVQA